MVSKKLVFRLEEREEREVAPPSKKSSMYDPPIDVFIKKVKDEGVDLVEVMVKDIKPDYLRTQLQKRIRKRELADKYRSVGTATKVYLEVIPLE